MLVFFKSLTTRLKKTMIKVKLSEKAYMNRIELSRRDWVIVNYDNVKFPGEIVNVVANELEVNVKPKSGNTFRK